MLGRRTALPLVGALGFSLSACQSGGSFTAMRGSPAGQPIAFESIEGPPPAVQTALTSELASAASARQVELASSSSTARYRVKGYLTTETTSDGGIALAFVWDVFDAQKRRAQRVTGSSPIRTAVKKDSWEALDKEELARLAAKSMDEIAIFLSANASGSPPGAEYKADGTASES